MLERGIDPAEILAKVDSLAGTEVGTPSAGIDELPTGSDLAGAAAFVRRTRQSRTFRGLIDVFIVIKAGPTLEAARMLCPIMHHAAETSRRRVKE